MASEFSTHLSHSARLACATASAAATAGIVGILLLGWDSQGDARWIAATPQVMSEVAGCDRRPSRSLRTQCKQALVAARLEKSAGSVVVASR